MAMMPAVSPLHDAITLLTSHEHYVLRPAQQPTTTSTLVIDRATFHIGGNNGQRLSLSQSQLIYGVLGVLRLHSGPHLITIADRQLVGKLFGHEIWEITRTEILPFTQSKAHLTEAQVKAETLCLHMLQSLLSQQSFYFSYTYDVTNSAQQQAVLAGHNPTAHLAPADAADPRFYWNRYLHRELLGVPEAAGYLIPVTFGFARIADTSFNGHACTYALFSRRNVSRAGTRFFRRGVDNSGHVANHIETEQIICCGAAVSSFVQVRGSIPVYWRQPPNLLYQPPFELVLSADHAVACRRHFSDLHTRYGDVTIINLINSTGREAPLGEVFTQAVSGLPRVKYHWFDFNRECSRMRWDRLELLMNKVDEERRALGFGLWTRSTPSLLRRQTGTIRTSCIDCLDRTNVVQFLLARITLVDQLVALGALPAPAANATIAARLEALSAASPLFAKLYTAIWADHADQCSLQYAGSTALKSDYTRTGLRTFQGLMHDASKSIRRYFINNFQDGYRQDAYDLLLGHAEISPNDEILQRLSNTDLPLRLRLLPLLLIAAVSMSIISLLLPLFNPPWDRLGTMFCFFCVFVFTQAILVNSPDLVNAPRLVPQARSSPPRLAVLIAQKFRQLRDTVRKQYQKHKRHTSLSDVATLNSTSAPAVDHGLGLVSVSDGSSSDKDA